MIHIASAATTNIPPCAGIRITVNTGYTGTCTLTDGAGTTQAVVTNPVTGNFYVYYGLISSTAAPATLVTTGAGMDITVSILSRTVN